MEDLLHLSRYAVPRAPGSLRLTDESTHDTGLQPAAVSAHASSVRTVIVVSKGCPRQCGHTQVAPHRGASAPKANRPAWGSSRALPARPRLWGCSGSLSVAVWHFYCSVRSDRVQRFQHEDDNTLSPMPTAQFGQWQRPSAPGTSPHIPVQALFPGLSPRNCPEAVSELGRGQGAPVTAENMSS